MFAPGYLPELTRYLTFELVDDVLAQTRTVQRRLLDGDVVRRTLFTAEIVLGLLRGDRFRRSVAAPSSLSRLRIGPLVEGLSVIPPPEDEQ